MCGCACGPKNWGADGCAAHYENVCDVRAGADENPRTLKVFHEQYFLLALLASLKAKHCRLYKINNIPQTFSKGATFSGG